MESGKSIYDEIIDIIKEKGMIVIDNKSINRVTFSNWSKNNEKSEIIYFSWGYDEDDEEFFKVTKEELNNSEIKNDEIITSVHDSNNLGIHEISIILYRKYNITQ